MDYTAPARIKKYYSYKGSRGTFYIPQRLHSGFFGRLSYVDFYMNADRKAVPMNYYESVSYKYKNIAHAKAHIQLYKEVYLDDNIVYELLEKPKS